VYVIEPVPPDALMLMVPFVPPKQETGVVFVVLIAGAN
jgi:hypothetical protein